MARPIWFHGGRVSGQTQKGRRQRCQQRYFTPRSQPVGSRAQMGASQQEGEEEHEKPLTREPYVPTLGLEGDSAQGIQLGGPRPTGLRVSPSGCEGGAPGRDGEQGEDARPGHHSRVPGAGGRTIGTAGEQEDLGPPTSAREAARCTQRAAIPSAVICEHDTRRPRGIFEA